MNTKIINIANKYLLLFLLVFTSVACDDNDDKEDTSIPVLISQNIEEGAVVGPNGYVELVFSKAMRQAPDTEIYFNGGVVRVSINYEKVRYTFSNMENKACTFEIPAGALTDMQGRAYDEDFFLNFTAKSEVAGSGKVFDAIVDPNGKGDFTSVQAAIDAASFELTAPYKIFIANGTYNECIRVLKNKSYIHLIGESRDGVKIQFALNRVSESTNLTTWPYSIYNEASAHRKAGYTEEQNAVVIVEGADFYAENISIINLYGALPSRYTGGLGKDGQAEALITRNNRFALYNCVLVSFQDTWWCRHNSGSENLAYIFDSQIEGRTDYIWGSGNIFVENSKFLNTGDGAYITASGETGTWGYVMKNCTVDGVNGITPFSFGRPYKQGTKTVWIDTQLKMDIIAAHWSSWSSLPALYGEYNTIDKNGQVISTEGKVVGSGAYAFTSSVLTSEEAAKYSYDKIVKASGWNPQEYIETPLATPTNVKLNEYVLTWDAVSNAAGYLIFMNGNYAGQTTDTTVTLNNVDSGNVYTVKTVSQNGTVSE